MKKVYHFIKDMGFVYLILSLMMMVLSNIIIRRFGVEISFLRITRASLTISFFITIALEVFKYDKLPSYLRIILGYMVLFYTTFIIRNLFGKRLFRTSIVLLVFILICTLIYFIILSIIIVRNKKEEKTMNEALKQFDEDE